MILASILCLAFRSHCCAQTTAPAKANVEETGAYENDSLRQAGDSGTSKGKTGAAIQNSYSAPLDFRRVVLALGIVLGLVFICRWAAGWLFPAAAAGRSSQVMKVLSRSVIAPKQQLLLIQVGRRLVVVGDCGQQMNTLAEISDPDEVAGLLGQLRADPPASERRNPFDPLLGRAQKQFDDLPAPESDLQDEEDGELAIAGVDETRGELSGLTEKIRLLSRQLGK